MSRDDGEGPGLGVRVFGVMGLVVLAGAGTLLVFALLLAPAVFHQHLADAGIDQGGPVAQHVNEGFAIAILTAIAVGILSAVLVAAAMAAVVARRVTAPIAETARTAERLASGDYSARTTSPGLGPELASLTRAVNALAERLESSERARLRLLTDLAHELRTPLASLDATVEAISDGVLPADDETLATLREQSRRLSHLVDDLSALSRADEHAFRVSTSPVDLVAAAGTAASMAAARYTAARVVLRSPDHGPVVAVADPDRVVEVLGQLLDNALRHCREGDTVSISVSRLGNLATLEVADTGAGFDPAEAEDIFRRFHRAGSSPDPALGGGIGLTIARALVEAQGGTLTARSDGPGRGATFIVTLPAA